MSSFEPHERASQVQSGQEITGGFFIAGSNGPEVFDNVEETFDEIGLAIEREVAWALDLAIRFWRDDNLDQARFEAFYEAAGIVSFAGKQGFGLHLCGQDFGLLDIVDVAAGQAEHQRIAERVDDHVDFGREPAARAPDRPVDPPFFSAPALC